MRTICKECQHCTFLSYNGGGDIMVHCCGLWYNNLEENFEHVIKEEMKDCDLFMLPEYNTSCFDEFGAFKIEYLPELRSQVVLGSIFLDDYANEYGIRTDYLCSFFEDYLNWLDEHELQDSTENLLDWYETSSYEITTEDLITEKYVKNQVAK